MASCSSSQTQVGFLTLFLHYSVTHGFEWFWIRSLCKSIALMLVFLKAPFLDLLFFLIYINNLLCEFTCNILIFADLLMIILFILSVIGILICDNNQSWSLNLNLTYNTLRKNWYKKGHANFSVGKLNVLHLVVK